MDWNLTNANNNNNTSSNTGGSGTGCSKLSTGKLMLSSMRHESSSMPSIFYPRSNIPGLEDHASGTTTTNLLYGGFEGSDQESVDVEVSDHEALHPVEKKRRLSVEQVRSLELSFEMENKLEPERKKKLAHELGLQPRQVAVWFQNRRARWKTKQLERDYEALKASYDTLVVENKRLQAEVANLVAKLEGKSTASLKEDAAIELHKLDVLTSNKTEEELQEDAVTVGTVTTGKNFPVPEDMDVVVSSKPSKAKKPEKQGSPCSDGYTSEILDAEYQLEAVPVVEENMLPSEQQQQQQQQQFGVLVPTAGAVVMDQPSAKDVVKDEPDGMVYDPHSNQLVFYKFEDGLVYNNEFDMSTSSSFYYSPDGFPWWT